MMKFREVEVSVTSTGNSISGEMGGQVITSCPFKAVNNSTDIPSRFEHITQVSITIIQKIFVSNCILEKSS